MIRQTTNKKTIQSVSSYNHSIERKVSNKLSIKTIATSREPSKVSIVHRLTTEPHKNETPAPLQPEW